VRPPLAGTDTGYYLEPTAMLMPSNEARSVARKSSACYGDQIYDDFDAAMRIANDSDHGLLSYLWSNDLQ
jgi:5-carboxymethyl-2-hydroxymuconic-semialdehyde dehydrogenase/aminomuconate-semialdehyde/2-hydroxymuconate-6-semialdehyde dehydrogenase